MRTFLFSSKKNYINLWHSKKFIYIKDIAHYEACISLVRIRQVSESQATCKTDLVLKCDGDSTRHISFLVLKDLGHFPQQ